MRSAVLLICFMTVSGVLSADTIYLTNGEVVDGKIIDETGDNVSVQQSFPGGGKATFEYKKSEIKSIERSEPERPATQTQPEATTAASGSGTGISYDALMRRLEQYFPMRQLEQLNGEDRCIGESENGLAMLEVLGNKSNISKANLVLGITGDYQGAAQNTQIIAYFCENAFPEWEGCTQWVSSVINARTDGTETRLNKTIMIQYRADMELIIITVKRSGT